MITNIINWNAYVHVLVAPEERKSNRMGLKRVENIEIQRVTRLCMIYKRRVGGGGVLIKRTIVTLLFIMEE